MPLIGKENVFVRVCSNTVKQDCAECIEFAKNAQTAMQILTLQKEFKKESCMCRTKRIKMTTIVTSGVHIENLGNHS